MAPTIYAARITYSEPLLGSAPLNAEVYTDYIASKAPPPLHANGTAAAEVETIEEIDIKGRTGFHRGERGEPLLLDYHWKGFLKEAWQSMRQIAGSESAALKAGKSRIDQLVFVEPRYIVLHLPAGGREETLERPLRAETAKGPRVALAASDMLPAGTWCDVRIVLLAPNVVGEALLREWLEYGRWRGMGGWRNGSFGRFTFNLKGYTR